jgi:hypothetical protein
VIDRVLFRVRARLAALRALVAIAIANPRRDSVIPLTAAVAQLARPAIARRARRHERWAREATDHRRHHSRLGFGYVCRVRSFGSGFGSFGSSFHACQVRNGDAPLKMPSGSRRCIWPLLAM